MSLLRKTLLYLLLVAIPVAVGGGWLFHTLIHRGIRYEVDEQLSSDLAYVSNQLSSAGTLPGRERYRIGNPHVTIVPASRQVLPVFTDTLTYDLFEKELVPVRKLRATIQVDAQAYLVTVTQAVGEFEEIARLLSVSIIVVFLLLMIVLIALNGWIARQLWQPFYTLIEQLRQYRLDARTPTVFTASNIDEFSQLQVALNTMSQNLHRQYAVQKEFTDHAAHEMQTPLAVVTTQLDQLLATEPLTDEQVAYMEQAQGSIRRLVHLNRSLLLLTKLDNQQFTDQQQVNLSEIVEKQYRNLEAYAHHRQLNWISHIVPDVYQRMNPYLADVLFSNLIKNVLVHARPGTNTEVTLTASGFSTTNAGSPLPFPVEQLFGRFVKNPARPESTGLGLALVEQIAERYGQTVQYRYNAATALHTFTVLFPVN
ncbi:sensor histidine kinase [Fibrella forsythiae]|uniref:histidine kinase n=1 Tax=Fibrella forsythiae TaxID=2817061 RepID=A0ABS3JNR2_9BACT|nr:HAMP domain-containing sensor histidine kinase [Fibrella forsythiae]MBO0951618.1 HAMP domain-containing histidine kinase [Fibrella forsythiae]